MSNWFSIPAPVHWSVLSNKLMDTNYLERFDVHESVHRDIIVKITNEMQLYRLIYYSKSALHVSGDVFAHHQEHSIHSMW
jgi:hypothetical protein